MSGETRAINVALIDDEKEFLLLSERFLKRLNENYMIKTFESPQEFLHYLQSPEREKIDVIVSDYEMPKINGLVLLLKLREKEVTIPFIMVSGKAREEIIIEALNKGVDFYLQKSMIAEAMFRELQNYIESAVKRIAIMNELNELKTMYETLVNLSPEGIMIHIDTIIQFINPALVKMLGYESEKELLGKPIFNIIHKDFHNKIKERMKLAYAGEAKSFIEAQFLKSDGTPLDILGTGRTIPYRNKTAIIVYVRDNNQGSGIIKKTKNNYYLKLYFTKRLIKVK